MPEVDAIVMGMGPGGEEVAGKLAKAGLETIGIDGNLLGGECPYWGCIPSKMMVRAGDVLAEGRRIPEFSGSSTVTPDWSPVAKRIREATDTWNDKAAVDRFEAKGGTFVRGWGRVVGPMSVEVGDETYTARRALVLNTGAQAWVPPMFESVPHWINRDAVECEELPASLLIIGGGAIGVEIGQAWSRFGVKITVVELGSRIVGPEEPEVSEILEKVLRSEGIEVHTGVTIESVEAVGDAGAVSLRLGDGTVLSADRMLVATGRRVDLAALGVGVLGIDEHAKALPVDGMLRVEGAPGVWGVGDVTGKGAFTHVSMYQARICVASILGEPIAEADYRALPRVTFTDPEIGSVGMTEAQAREDGGHVTVMSEPIPDSTRGWIHKAQGLVKMVAADGVLVGGTSMAPSGGEVLGLLTLAVHARVPVATLKEMIYAYPTFHRAIDSALWKEG
ncbi:MAG TPA: NAD(P)/FAD-dependent oxidoreductase [Acidimicrobiales bacterium]|jgi:pyruvate/2-oxoglutarate dehydrogenase complex dihydrolipoamide dehydrogenase (E3) component